MSVSELANVIDRCFISPNVSDSNMEPANVVDVIDDAARSLSRIAYAITPKDAVQMRFGSLTESVIYAANNMGKIAEAIKELANAVRDRKA